MQTFTLTEIIFIMAATLFILGVTTFVTGVVILVKRVYSKDIRQITEQTSKLAQKGLAQDISGLVGNASSLLIATSEMVKTSSGSGLCHRWCGRRWRAERGTPGAPCRARANATGGFVLSKPQVA